MSVYYSESEAEKQKIAALSLRVMSTNLFQMHNIDFSQEFKSAKDEGMTRYAMFIHDIRSKINELYSKSFSTLMVNITNEQRNDITSSITGIIDSISAVSDNNNTSDVSDLSSSVPLSESPSASLSEPLSAPLSEPLSASSVITEAPNTTLGDPIDEQDDQWVNPMEIAYDETPVVISSVSSCSDTRSVTRSDTRSVTRSVTRSEQRRSRSTILSEPHLASPPTTLTLMPHYQCYKLSAFNESNKEIIKDALVVLQPHTIIDIRHNPDTFIESLLDRIDCVYDFVESVLTRVYNIFKLRFDSDFFIEVVKAIDDELLMPSILVPLMHVVWFRHDKNKYGISGMVNFLLKKFAEGRPKSGEYMKYIYDKLCLLSAYNYEIYRRTPLSRVQNPIAILARMRLLEPKYKEASLDIALYLIRKKRDLDIAFNSLSNYVPNEYTGYITSRVLRDLDGVISVEAEQIRKKAKEFSN